MITAKIIGLDTNNVWTEILTYSWLKKHVYLIIREFSLDVWNLLDKTSQLIIKNYTDT